MGKMSDAKTQSAGGQMRWSSSRCGNIRKIVEFVLMTSMWSKGIPGGLAKSRISGSTDLSTCGCGDGTLFDQC
jgi:hypothetical protein